MKKNTEQEIPEIYRRKLNGFRCSHRNRWILLNHHKLSIQSLALYEFYIDISDFDRKHLTYGTFKVNLTKIATIFSCSSNTIRNWHNQLKIQNLISQTDERDVFRLSCPERYIAPGMWKGEASAYAKTEKNQTVEIIFQTMSQGIQSVSEIIKPVEQKITKDIEELPSRALGYSKYSSKVDESKGQLTEEDKEWIKNIY